MKIFISWSGKISQKIAFALREWIPTVIQAVDPYMSSHDIPKGALWTSDLFKQLENAEFGIVCVVPDNKLNSWMNFEAGAISKVVGSRLVPFIFGLEKNELENPLALFQAVSYKKEEVKLLIKNINEKCSDGKLNQDLIDKTFNKFWPDLKKKIDPLILHFAGKFHGFSK